MRKILTWQITILFSFIIIIDIRLRMGFFYINVYRKLSEYHIQKKKVNFLDLKDQTKFVLPSILVIVNPAKKSNMPVYIIMFFS